LLKLIIAVDLAGQQAVSSGQEHLWACLFQVWCVLFYNGRFLLSMIF